MEFTPYLGEAAPPLAAPERGAAWQQVAGFIPDQLALFYTECNGGLSKASLVPLPDGGETVLNLVFSLAGGPYPSLVEETRELREGGMLPADAIAFAEDPGGNFFAIALDPADFGKVFFVDHEVWVEAPRPTLRQSANATPVAKDLVSFLKLLKEDTA